MPGEEPDREWLGRYASLEAFALEVVAPLVRSEGRWLLACLDVGRVLRVLAGDDRLTLERGWVVLERVRGAVRATDNDSAPRGASRPERRGGR